MDYNSLPKKTSDSELIPAPEFSRSGKRIASVTGHESPATLYFCEDEKQRKGEASLFD
jgi:hypothetical protein